MGGNSDLGPMTARELVGYPRRAVKASLAVPTLMALVVLGACATVDVTTTQYVGAPRFQPTEPNEVQILRTEPTAPHDRLGEVMVGASADPAPPIAEVEQKLCQAAATLGADAVVVVYDSVQPVAAYVTGPWWGQSIESMSGRKLIAVAIRSRR